MKNIKVTYLGSNYSTKLANLISPNPINSSYTATFEYNNISDKTCEELQEQLELLDFVMKVEVTDASPSKEAEEPQDHQPQGTPKTEENKLL